MTPEQRAMRSRVGAHIKWANTSDRTEATAAARAKSPTSLTYWERRIDPDGTMPAAERTQRATSAHRAHMVALALKSSQARAARKAGAA